MDQLYMRLEEPTTKRSNYMSCERDAHPNVKEQNQFVVRALFVVTDDFSTQIGKKIFQRTNHIYCGTLEITALVINENAGCEP